MALYVLDTDILTLYQKGHAKVCQRVLAHPRTDTAVTVITVEEQLSGWYVRLRQARTPKAKANAYFYLAQNVESLAAMTILPFTESAILRSEQLVKLKLNIRKNDVRIAAIVLEHGGVLVSRNVQDFQRVPQLPVEDWTA